MPLIIQPAGTSMAPSDEQSGLLKFLNQPLWSHTRLNRRDAGVMTRELATLLDAGLTVDQALGFLIDVADSQPKRELFADLLEKVQGGSTLADAMSAHPSAFPIAYVSLIRAGEAGNALGDVFARLSDYLERAEELSQQVRSALVYPLMLMFMAGISIAILLTVVLPQFTPMFESAGTDLPWLTLVVVAVGDAAERYWWLALIGALFITLWFGTLLRDPSSRAVIDRRLLGLPLIGDLVAKIDTARLARTLGTLLANGVALPSALTIAKDTMNNAALRDALGTTIAAVKEGKGLSRPTRPVGAPPAAGHQPHRRRRAVGVSRIDADEGRGYFRARGQTRRRQTDDTSRACSDDRHRSGDRLDHRRDSVGHSRGLSTSDLILPDARLR